MSPGREAVTARDLAAAVGDVAPSRRLGEAPVLAALAAIVVGVASLAVLARPEPPGDASPEAGFARDMATHHAQAVEVADIVRARTTDPEVRALATDMALTQQAQIGMLSGWLRAWGLPASGDDLPMAWMGHPTDEPMPGMASRADIAALHTAAPDEADRQFLALMIPHHRGEVLMARAVLARTDRTEVVALASAIVTGQSAEVVAMEGLLVHLGGSPVTRAVTMPAPDDGHGHGETFFGSVRPSARAVLRLLPAASGLFAAAWLVADGVRRRRVWAADVPAGAPVGSAAARLVAVIGLGLAGLAHLALAPDHFGLGWAHGTFFVTVGCGQLVLAAVLIAWPSRPAWVCTAGTSLFLLAVYAASRLAALPGTDGPEAVDAVGLAVQVAQAATVAAATGVVRRTATDMQPDLVPTR